MEEIPFIYGKIAIGKDFCDREKRNDLLGPVLHIVNQRHYCLSSRLG